MKRPLRPKCIPSDSDVIDKLAAIFLTLPTAKAYVFFESKDSDERVTPSVIKQSYDILERVLTSFRRRPFRESLSQRAWKRYRVLADRSRNDGWCVDEAQKLHMVWKWIWAAYKRKPELYKNEEIRKLKDILADDGARSEHSSSERSSDHARVNTVDADEAEAMIDLSSDDDDYDEEEGSEDEGDSDNDTAASQPSQKQKRTLKAQASLISVASSEAPSCSSRPVRPAAVSLEFSASTYTRQGHREHVRREKALNKKPAAAKPKATKNILKPLKERRLTARPQGAPLDCKLAPHAMHLQLRTSR